MIKTEVRPGMIKTSEDAIPLELMGTIEVKGGVQMHPMSEGHIERDRDDRGRYQSN